MNKQKLETAVRMIVAATESIEEELPEQSMVGSETFQIYNLALTILDKVNQSEKKEPND